MLPPMPAMPPDAELVLIHDARAIHDTASLRFEAFVTDTSASWILATITPSPESGSTTIPGAFIEGGTGTVVMPRDAQTIVVNEGTWTAIAASPQNTRSTSGKYSWSSPMAEEKRILVPEDYYSPFTRGGTILFRPSTGEKGLKQFGSVSMLFPKWSVDVSPAFAEYAAHPQEFDSNGAAPINAPRLESLVSQQNKLLAVVAFRTLLTSGLVNPDFVRTQLTRANEQLCAIFSYLTIVHIGPPTARLGMPQILQAIDTASKPQIRAIALGAFAASLFNARDAGIQARAKDALRKVRQRLTALGEPTKQDPQLSLIFSKLDV